MGSGWAATMADSTHPGRSRRREAATAVVKGRSARTGLAHRRHQCRGSERCSPASSGHTTLNCRFIAGLFMLAETNPIRPCSCHEPLSLPTQPHHSLNDQLVDRGESVASCHANFPTAISEPTAASSARATSLEQIVPSGTRAANSARMASCASHSPQLPLTAAGRCRAYILRADQQDPNGHLAPGTDIVTLQRPPTQNGKSVRSCIVRRSLRRPWIEGDRSDFSIMLPFSFRRRSPTITTKTEGTIWRR